MLVGGSFFLRGISLGPLPSSSYLASIGAVLLILDVVSRALLLQTAPRIHRSGYIWIAFICCAFSSVVANLYISRNPGHIARVGSELMLSVTLPMICLLAVSSRRRLSLFFIAVLFGSVGTALYYWIPLLTGSFNIRRLTASTEVYALAATNHSAQVLSVGLVIAIALTIHLTSNIRRLLAMATACVLAPLIVVIGSRSAIIAVAVSVLTIVAFHSGMTASKRRGIGGMIGLIAVLGIVLASALKGLSDRTTMLMERYRIENVISSGTNRIVLAIDAMDSFTNDGILQVVFGNLSAYEPDANDRIRNQLGPDSHNIVVNLLVYTGVPTAVLFVFGLWQLGTRLVRELRLANPSSSWYGSASLASVIVTLIYSLSSGRMTRVLTVFIMIGIAEAALRLSKSEGNGQEGAQYDPAGHTRVQSKSNASTYMLRSNRAGV